MVVYDYANRTVEVELPEKENEGLTYEKKKKILEILTEATKELDKED